jgi:hypothetical protein
MESQLHTCDTPTARSARSRDRWGRRTSRRS